MSEEPRTLEDPSQEEVVPGEEAHASPSAPAADEGRVESEAGLPLEAASDAASSPPTAGEPEVTAEPDEEAAERSDEATSSAPSEKVAVASEASSELPAPPDDALPPKPPQPPAADERARSAGRFFPPTWALLVLLLGVLMVVGVALGFLRQTWLTPRPGGDAEPLTVEKLATFDSPPTLPQNLQILQENGMPLSPALPSTLAIRDLRYAVIPVPLEDGRWPVPAAQDEDVAVWVYGTVINYVIGLPYTTTTESRLAALTPGERITLTLENGTQLVFGSPQAQRYAATDTTPLSQTQPGLTLVVLGASEGGTGRLVVQARYLPDAGSVEGGAQQIDGLEVQVLEAGLAGEVDDGRDFIVEFQVAREEGAAAVETEWFDFVLEDGEGRRYATNPSISQQGKHGPLPSQIAPGEVVQGSAGYRVPRDVQPPLTWIFRADATSSDAVRFPLPYEPPLPGPPQPQVELTDAFVDDRQDAIVINGVVRNVGSSPLDVAETEVKLSSSAGEMDLLVASPPLPWRIAAGGEQIVELQFARPSGVDSVLLDVLGFTFQIEGLP
ncbi:MAG: hypothetical protein ACP5HM_00790 [Anaerolineae bacterium]